MRPRPAGPLRAARAGAGAAYCVALALVALSLEHPVLLGALLGVVLAAGRAAGVGSAVRRSLAWGLPFALAIALVNALVTRDGLTVLVRGWSLPVTGPLDITLEATLYGLVLGLRAVVLLACFALYSAAVDPDELLRGLRRASVRSALTATLTTRLVPVLARDARRLRDAQRCRPDGGATRLALVRGVTTGALDRALDVAATLEVRGYGAGRRPPRRPRPWSRQDLAFATAAVGLVAVAMVVAFAGWDPFVPYPRLLAPLGPEVWGLAALLAAVALAPFAVRRGAGVGG